jgi:bifunctional DNA-binding transcriptional regulator/antitoxin component of YhaV-PrlF toxin-antitoxin module
MPTTTVSSKGQITLPAALVRDRHLVGQVLSITENPDGSILLRRRLSLDELLDSVVPHAIYGSREEADTYLAAEREAW